MAPLTVILLTLQGVVFATWTFLAFRFLFALRRDAVASSGQLIPGLRATLSSFRGGLVDPRYRDERIRLAVVTVVMFALIATFAVLAPLD